MEAKDNSLSIVKKMDENKQSNSDKINIFALGMILSSSDMISQSKSI